MNKFNIYVGNVESSVTEEQLRSLFSQYGMVLAVKMIKDKFTGDARGFAFVEMASPEEGQNAIAKTNGTELNGKRLSVNEARPREDRGGSNGGDRGGARRPFGGSNGGGNRFGGSRF